MAKKHDDLAAALNALADGHHDSTAGEAHDADAQENAPATPPPTQPVRPAKVARPATVAPSTAAAPAVAKPSAPVPKTTAAPTAKFARPAAPATPPPSAPVAAPTPPSVTAETRPASRVRAAAPSARPTAPSSPVAPPPPPAPIDATDDSPFDHAPPEDDDAVIVPAPDQSVFAPRPKAAAPVRKGRVPVYQTLHFRQTVIPVMLTSGVMALLLGGIRFALSDDSIFSAVPSSIAIVLIVLGLLLLGAAALNIVQVKQMIEAEKPAKR